MFNKKDYKDGKCDFCKEEKKIRRTFDPFLLDAYDKKKKVDICDKCYSMRLEEV